jgi:phosphoribosylformimino-5-aminoimidazole carboxamide ribotide isomerase
MKIIPAIDIIGGKCVRLTQGDYDRQRIYNEDPLEVAKAFEAHGLRYLHLVDLDGARAGRIANQGVLERIASQTRLQIDFGGGVRTEQDVRIALESGARQVTGGSIAAKEPEKFAAWLGRFGADRIILGADCRDRRIAVQGWGEHLDLDVADYIRDYLEKGVRYVVCTDIALDGMLEGPAFGLYEELSSMSGLKLIASGGVSCMEDLRRLAATGCEGAIVGKAIYENRISLQELSELC